MGPLLLLLLLALSWTAALNLLSFGDSVDRMMVEDWCAAYGASKLPTCGGYECTYWLEAAGILKPRIFPTSSMFCSAAKANDTVAFVQVYGSPDTMPYFKNGNADNTGNSYRNNYYVNTPERIKAGVDGYFKLVGVPDLVVFNSVLWDVSRLYETQGTWKQPLHGDYDFPHSPLFNASVVDFEINLRKRIQDIETALGRNLFNLTTATTTANNTLSTLQRRVRDRMGLRTAVYNVANGVLVRAFNDIIRRVAAELELTLYDYDMDLWSHVGYGTLRLLVMPWSQFLLSLTSPSPYLSLSQTWHSRRSCSETFSTRCPCSRSWPPIKCCARFTPMPSKLSARRQTGLRGCGGRAAASRARSG